MHDSRTALRRLEMCIGLMGRSVFNHRRAERLCSKLHDAVTSLAMCRDADVMTAGLASYLRTHQSARRDLAPLMRFLAKRRRRGQARVERRLPRHLPAQVTRFLGRGIVHGGYIGKKQAGPALVRQFTHEQIWHQYGCVLAFQNRIPGSAETLHAFRGVCRQLRFALELFGDALPASLPLARDLHVLQRQVGAMHDHHAAQAMIHKAVKRKRLERTDALKTYERFLRTERDRLEQGLEAHARSILEPEFRMRLARSLGETTQKAALPAEAWQSASQRVDARRYPMKKSTKNIMKNAAKDMVVDAADIAVDAAKEIFHDMVGGGQDEGSSPDVPAKAATAVKAVKKVAKKVAKKVTKKAPQKSGVVKAVKKMAKKVMKKVAPKAAKKAVKKVAKKVAKKVTKKAAKKATKKKK